MFKIFGFFGGFFYFVFQEVNNDSKITEGKVIDAKLLTNNIDQSCDSQENECYEYLYFLNIFYFNKMNIYDVLFFSLFLFKYFKL